MQSQPLAATRRFESRFTTADGESLFRRAWLPQEPSASLLLVHGFAEHSGRYDEFGSWFAARGCAVHSFDHRGHGRSPGHRNYVRRFGEFLDDLAAFEQLVGSECEGLPLVLVGHSMGGLISASYARERATSVAGVALSGAALMPPASMPKWQQSAVRFLRLIRPRLMLSSGIAADALSRDPEIVRRYIEDPLIDTRVTASLAAEMMAASQRIAGRGGELRLPVLLMHGGADPICPPAGSESFFAAHRGSGGGSDCWSRLHVYPELRHEIFNEPEHETVFADLFGWIQELGAAQVLGPERVEGASDDG